MNDYGIEAIKALSWARVLLKKCTGLASFIQARGEIEEMILKLASGAAVSFKRRQNLSTSSEKFSESYREVLRFLNQTLLFN